MENQNNNQAVMTALGYPAFALPQTIVPVTKTQNQIQRTQYSPEKIKAVMDALQKPRILKTRGEVIAEALANIPETRSFTGGFGEEIINPWDMALTSFARGFGSVYKSKKEDEREREKEAREDAIKAAQLALEADKSVVTDSVTNDWIKYNLDPSAKQALAEQEANKKLAQTAYVKLNPNLPDDIRNNPDAFGYLAREADLGGRTPAGGTTGMLERVVASAAKAKLGDENAKIRGRISQEMAQYVGAVTDMARQGGATGQMMNSDKEGQRALQIMSNPSAYDAETLAAAAEVIVDLYDRMLAVKGLPSVREGYNQVTGIVESRKPKAKEDVWASYRD